MVEPLDLYVGRRVLEDKLVSHEQLLECVLEQEDERQARTGQLNPRPIGQMLVAKGFLKAAELKMIQAEPEAPGVAQGASFECPTCGKRFTIKGAKPNGRYGCKGCGGMLKRVDVPVKKTVQRAAALSDTQIHREETDRALLVYIRQKNILRKEDLKIAERLHGDMLRYGINVGLMDLLKMRKIVTWRQAQDLEGLDLGNLVKSESWRNQAIPGYTITGKIGSGGFATLFNAMPVFGTKPVALKILKKERAQDQTSLARFRAECTLMMTFDHPNIVKAYDFIESPPLYYIIMEYVKGDPLDVVIRELGGLGIRDAFSVARQTAQALFHMQEGGYLHRDVKPSNVILEEGGRVKVCDLGFATPIKVHPGALKQNTLGTPQYISPEQARGEEDLKIGADIYSLGLTLFEMLAGRPAFQGESSEAIMAERFMGGVAEPDYGLLKVPSAVLMILRKMLAADREHRYATYPELINTLKSLEG